MSAVAHSSKPSNAIAVFDFNIAAQPLSEALAQYGKVSGQPALFDADLLRERYSHAIRGQWTPQQALKVLLQGTGLTVESFQSEHGHTFVLKEAGEGAEGVLPSLSSFLTKSPHAGEMQSRILDLLCRNPHTKPGSYSLLMRFQLDEAGDVSEAKVLGTTGDTRRDAWLQQALQGFPLGFTPPAWMRGQPMTMLLEPGARGVDCDRRLGAP
ncbi:hypothetical protein F3J24_21560 [Comamonas sp. Tr-654]|uniref:STN domain-containing protein n=1 Tax=Comamonas sp. Tr-654 TaxID=2608341 RepID=UPI00142489CE|nr:STN domain-containing protein [Comamonas sp. Tr-654]NIF86069.1 hypothetical protein [Comamonas sp. Tr-654]